MPTYYVTRAVLLDGIRTIESDGPGPHQTLQAKAGSGNPDVYDACEWFTDRGEAVAHAEDLRARAIRTLKEGLARLEQMNFD